MQNNEGRIQKGEGGSRNGTRGMDGEHLTPSPSPQSGEGGKVVVRGQYQHPRPVPAWWLDVPDAEKAVIRDVLKSIRGLKGSCSPMVGRAARKWERSIACFIKFRLMGESGEGISGRSGQHRRTQLTISSPSSGRTQRYAAPGQR